MALVLHVNPKRSIILEFGIKGGRYLLLGCVNGTTRCPLTTNFFFLLFSDTFLFFSIHVIFFNFVSIIQKLFWLFLINFFFAFSTLNQEKLYRSYGRWRYLFTISIKNSHLFKIIESVFSFYLKLYNFKQVRVFYWNGIPHYLFTISTL